MEWYAFENALKFLAENFPKTDKKPTFYHSVRVATFLWNHWYAENIQIAWLMHDALEDTKITEKQILENFWSDVLKIVKVNSKNLDIEKDKRNEDIVSRCANLSKHALIVKLADVYDNFLFYKKENNQSEIERCKRFATMIDTYKKNEWTDKIFNVTTIILEY